MTNLELADALQAEFPGYEVVDVSAAELRRLHDVEMELQALRAQIGQGVPVATLTMFDMRSQTGTVDLVGDWKELRVGDPLYTNTAPQAESDASRLASAIADAATKCGITDASKHSFSGPQLLMLLDDMVSAVKQAAHNIGEKK